MSLSMSVFSGFLISLRQIEGDALQVLGGLYHFTCFACHGCGGKGTFLLRCHAASLVFSSRDRQWARTSFSTATTSPIASSATKSRICPNALAALRRLKAATSRP